MKKGCPKAPLESDPEDQLNLKTVLGLSTDFTDFTDGTTPDSFLDLAERPTREVNSMSCSTL